MRCSRSVPAAWIVLAKSTWRPRQVRFRILGELLTEDQELLSGVRSSCDMLARNSDL